MEDKSPEEEEKEKKRSEERWSYDELIDFVYHYTWPPLHRFMTESIERFMGNKRIGVFGSYQENGDGWTKIEYLSHELVRRNYAVLTGKGVFKSVKKVIIRVPIIPHVAPYIVDIKTYCRWFVTCVPQAIILLGKLRSTAEPEEDEAYRQKIETYGVAIIDKVSSSVSCEKLVTSSIKGKEFSVCKGRLGDCIGNMGKYCPFSEKGVPFGSLDLYTRSRHMHLMATSKKENVIGILRHLEFIE